MILTTFEYIQVPLRSHYVNDSAPFLSSSVFKFEWMTY